MKFNLSQFRKEAMGAIWQRNRLAMKWSLLEDAIKGNAIALGGQGEEAVTWAQLVSENESIGGLLNEALSEKAKKIALFTDRYAASREQIRKLNLFYVAYHPLYGAYFMSVGPYCTPPRYWDKVKDYALEKGHDRITDEDIEEAYNSQDPELKAAGTFVKADMKNQFSFFKKRYAIGDEATITRAITKFINKRVKEYAGLAQLSGAKIELTPDDITLRTKILKPDKEEGGVNLKKLTKLVSGLSPKNPELIKLYEQKPVLGTDSNIVLNSRGLAKIMEAASVAGNWKDIFDKSIEATAKAMGQDFETTKNMALADMEMLKLILKNAAKMRQELKLSGDPRAATMSEIPDKATIEFMMKDARVGQQQMQALSITDTIINLALLKTQILQTVAETKSNDPVVIANAIKDKRAKKTKGLKAQGEVTPEFIEAFLERIKVERAIRDEKGHWTKKKKSFNQLYEESKETYEFLVNAKKSKVDEGFPTLKKCIEVASMHFYSPDESDEGGVREVATTLDYATKAKMDFLKMPPPDLFNWNSKNNYSSETLTAMRLEAERQGKLTQGGTEAQQIADSKIMSPAMLKKEILADVEPVEEIDEVQKEVEKQQIEQEPVLPNDGGVVVEDPAEKETLEPEVLPAEAQPEVQEQDFPIVDIPAETEEGKVPKAPEAGQDFPVEEVNPQQGIVAPVAPANPAGQGVVPKKEQKKRKIPVKNEINPVAPVENPVASSLISLIKIARELDKNGKYAASEDIHKVLRKYQSRIK